MFKVYCVESHFAIMYLYLSQSPFKHPSEVTAKGATSDTNRKIKVKNRQNKNISYIIPNIWTSNNTDVSLLKTWKVIQTQNEFSKNYYFFKIRIFLSKGVTSDSWFLLGVKVKWVKSLEKRKFNVPISIYIYISYFISKDTSF